MASLNVKKLIAVAIMTIAACDALRSWDDQVGVCDAEQCGDDRYEKGVRCLLGDHLTTDASLNGYSYYVASPGGLRSTIMSMLTEFATVSLPRNAALRAWTLL